MFLGFCIQISFFSLFTCGDTTRKPVMVGYSFDECSYQCSYSSCCVYFHEAIIIEIPNKTSFSGTQKKHELELISDFAFSRKD